MKWGNERPSCLFLSLHPPPPPPQKKKVSNRGLKSDKVSLKLRKNNIFSQKTKKRKYFVPGNGKKLQKIYENKKKPNIFATSLAGKKWIAKPGYITQQQENMPWTTWGRNSQILERGSGGYRRLCTLQAYQTYRCLSWKHLLQSTVQIGIGTQASADKNESTLSLQCYMVEKFLLNYSFNRAQLPGGRGQRSAGGEDSRLLYPGTGGANIYSTQHYSVPGR